MKPKPRTRSARDLRSKPESKAKPEIEWGGIWGEGLGSHSSENFENSYLKPCNLVYIVQLFKQTFLSFPSGGSKNLPKMNTYHISIPAKFSYIVYVFVNVVNSPLGSIGVHGRVVHGSGSLFLDPARTGETLTRPSIADKKSDPTRPNPRPGQFSHMYIL